MYFLVHQAWIKEDTPRRLFWRWWLLMTRSMRPCLHGKYFPSNRVWGLVLLWLVEKIFSNSLGSPPLGKNNSPGFQLGRAGLGSGSCFLSLERSLGWKELDLVLQSSLERPSGWSPFEAADVKKVSLSTDSPCLEGHTVLYRGKPWSPLLTGNSQALPGCTISATNSFRQGLQIQMEMKKLNDCEALV